MRKLVIALLASTALSPAYAAPAYVPGVPLVTQLNTADFDRAAALAETYGGAVISLEGHADPLAYLQALATMEKTPASTDKLKLQRMVQGARGLSVQRAQQVRDAMIAEAKSKGISLDPGQFDVVGLGYDDPVTRICGDRPCEPKTQDAWLSNMVVKFRVLNVEAEATAFVPVH